MSDDAQMSSERTRKGDSPPLYPRTTCRCAFTIIELLVVIAIVAILTAMILPAVSRSERGGRTVTCMNHLKQVGVAMEMYISDHKIYPSAVGGGGPPFKTWADQLVAYNPLKWTNLSWHCPTYLAEGGNVIWQPPAPGPGPSPFKVSSSYAYNAFGMSGYGYGTNRLSLGRKGPWLGLGDLRLTVSENSIVAPSDMYAVGDTRPFRFQGQTGFKGPVEMHPWQLLPSALNAKFTEAKPPHSDGYNLLFVDGHVARVKRQDYLFPPRSAPNWNRDNQPHPELWSPTNEWAVQN